MTTASLADRLKTETREDHISAEQHPVQRRLISGGLTLTEFGEYLAAMRRLHAAYEPVLRELMVSAPVVGAVVKPEHFRLANLDADLAALGRTADAGASAAAVKLGAWAADASKKSPAALLGLIYVLEGSTNGGTFIARAIRGRLPDAPTSYLDPHGPMQRERWSAFRAALDSLTLDETTRDAIVAAAQLAFKSVEEHLDEAAGVGV